MKEKKIHTISDNLIQQDFQQKNINNDKITIDEADKDQSDLLIEIMNLRKILRKILFKANIHFLKVDKRFLMILEVEYFHYQQLKVQDIQI